MRGIFIRRSSGIETDSFVYLCARHRKDDAPDPINISCLTGFGLKIYNNSYNDVVTLNKTQLNPHASHLKTKSTG